MARAKRVETKLTGMDRKVLLQALKTTQAAIDKNAITGIEQAQDFIIRRNRVIAYNDSIAISTPLEMDTKLDLTVRADDLYGVLQGIKDARIELDLTDEGQLCVTSDSTTAWLAVDGLGETLEDLINGMGLDKLEDETWDVLPDDFNDALVLCAFAASPKKENTHYNNLYLNGRDIWSTDDYRISNYKFSKNIEFELENVLLPLASATELIKHTPREVQQIGSWVHFKNGSDLMFSARCVDVDFPDCEKFMKIKGEAMALPEELADALKAVVVFSPGQELYNQEAHLKFENGALVCSAKNDRGEIHRTVPLQNVDGGLDALPAIIINPTFFAEVLSHTADITVEGSKAMFSTRKFRHIMNLTMEEE